MAQDTQPSPPFHEADDKIGQLFTLNATTAVHPAKLTERAYFSGGGPLRFQDLHLRKNRESHALNDLEGLRHSTRSTLTL